MEQIELSGLVVKDGKVPLERRMDLMNAQRDRSEAAKIESFRDQHLFWWPLIALRILARR